MFLSILFGGIAVFVCWYLLKVKKTDLTPKQLQELLTDRVVIVTGSARGLGKFVAKQYALCGAKIVMVDLREDILSASAEEIAKSVGADKVLAINGDLSDKEFCRKVIEETIAKFGKLDVLYINHGIMPVGPVFTNSIEMIEKVVNVNFMSFVYLAKLALPHIRASKGMIGLTSSMAGKTAMMNLAHYCCSKHALLGFFDVLRLEEKQYGVSVTVVCPGPMRTDLVTDGFGPDALKQEKIKHHLPEDIAPGVVNAVTSRRREHFTDTYMRVAGIIRALFPQTIDNLLGPLSAQQ
jgi:NAD(P)-dependent dehydrogenase (short-subunit alcohol dehydrogenase family)